MPLGLGSLDSNGVWQFGQDDAEALASDLLNIGQASISTQFGVDRARMDDIEDDLLLLPGPVTAFTPAWTNLTPGAGSQAWYYQNVRGLVNVWGVTTLGTGFSVGTNPFIAPPVAGVFANGDLLGQAMFDDAGVRYHGSVHYEGSLSAVLPRRFFVSGTNIQDNTISSAAPFTWASGDRIAMRFEYRAA